MPIAPLFASFTQDTDALHHDATPVAPAATAAAPHGSMRRSASTSGVERASQRAATQQLRVQVPRPGALASAPRSEPSTPRLHPHVDALRHGASRPAGRKAPDTANAARPQLRRARTQADVRTGELPLPAPVASPAPALSRGGTPTPVPAPTSLALLCHVGLPPFVPAQPHDEVDDELRSTADHVEQIAAWPLLNPHAAARRNLLLPRIVRNDLAHVMLRCVSRSEDGLYDEVALDCLATLVDAKFTAAQQRAVFAHVAPPELAGLIANVHALRPMGATPQDIIGLYVRYTPAPLPSVSVRDATASMRELQRHGFLLRDIFALVHHHNSDTTWRTLAGAAQVLRKAFSVTELLAIARAPQAASKLAVLTKHHAKILGVGVTAAELTHLVLRPKAKVLVDALAAKVTSFHRGGASAATLARTLDTLLDGRDRNPTDVAQLTERRAPTTGPMP